MVNDAILVTGCRLHRLPRCATYCGGRELVGVDIVNDYYDPALKRARLAEPRPSSFVEGDLADHDDQNACSPSTAVVMHLAAQAGVRYSLQNPHAYIESNVRVHQRARMPASKCGHFSTHRQLGLRRQHRVPFSVHDNVDHPVSLYAATKKANELMAHSYSHLYRLPTTGLRFFTVYGPWGRPDMAMFLFTKAILAGKPIQLFNHGAMRRDFTYIDDIVEGVVRVLDRPPQPSSEWSGDDPDPATSKAPYPLYNIGNNSPRRADERRRAAGKGIRPHRDQGDAADAARRRPGDLCRCR